MFRPSLAIFRKLFTFLIRRTALDLRSIYFNAISLQFACGKAAGA
jgi:hypothetical protein